MFVELPINLGSKSRRAFLQDGFFCPLSMPSPLHKHDFAELHAVLGDATYQLGPKTYSLKSGDVLLIPKGEIHYCSHFTPQTPRVTFQIDLSVSEPSVRNVGEFLLSSLVKEIENCRKRKRYAGIAAYIALLCEAFETEPPLQPRVVTDHELLIREFFSLYYNQNVHLSDLAAILHLSERQTERQVFAHTGHSFRQELTDTRMRIAKHLKDTTDMPLSAIAEYVGYTSYAGFWKAFRQYRT